MKIFCVTWAPFSRRMDEIAAELKAERWDYCLLFKMKVLAPFRYLIMAFRTLIELFKRKPDVIIAQNPPVFLPITCWVYCLLARCTLIVDHHCIWSEKTIRYPLLSRVIRGLEGFIVRRAELNTSPHDVWTEKLIELSHKKAKVITVIDYVEELPMKKVSRERFCRTDYLVVYPGGTGPYERPDVAIEAVKELEGVTLVITGKKEFLKRILPHESDRIVFSGFLPDEEYFGLLREADVVLNITDEPYTIPHFLYEVMAAGTPIISSWNLPIAKLFNGSIYLIEENSPENLKKAIIEMQRNREEWVQKIRKLRDDLKRVRRDQIQELMDYIQRKGS